MNRPVTAKNYLFLGGPMDGERMRTNGEETFMVPVPPELRTMLQSSLDVLEKGAAIVSPVRVARYVLTRRAFRAGTPGAAGLALFDRQAYRFDGWES